MEIGTANEAMLSLKALRLLVFALLREAALRERDPIAFIEGLATPLLEQLDRTESQPLGELSGEYVKHAVSSRTQTFLALVEQAVSIELEQQADDHPPKDGPQGGL